MRDSAVSTTPPSVFGGSLDVDNSLKNMEAMLRQKLLQYAELRREALAQGKIVTDIHSLASLLTDSMPFLALL